MKFLLLLFILHSTCLHAQIDKLVQYDYHVTYDYTFQPDKHDSSLKVTEVMLLQAGPLYSHFCSYNTYKQDSAIFAFEEQMKKSNVVPVSRTTPRAKLHYRIFKEHPEQTLHFATAFGVKRANYQEKLPVFNWQLEDEEQTIAGYACKKATTSFGGRDYIAWYAPGIAIADGPYKFYGLPGLILAIYDNRQQHVFTAITVERKSKAIMLTKWKGVYMRSFDSRQAFTDYAESLKARPELMYEQDLIKVPQELTEQIVAEIRQSIAKFTNPIELP